MKKHIFGRKFKRDVNERKALFKNLMSELVLHGRIKITEQKAKAIRSSAEKLIKKAQKEVNLARKLLASDLIPKAIDKVIKDVAPQFSTRPGGYTRMVKVGRRFNDDASMVVMEWVEYTQSSEKKTKKQSASDNEIVEAEIVSEKPTKEKVTKKAQSKTPAKKAISKKAQPKADRPLDEK